MGRGRDAAIRTLNAEDANGNFFGGTVGAAWLLTQFAAHAPSATAAAALAEFDQVLFESVADVTIASPPPIGLWDGVAGWLTYALARRHDALLDMLCDLLARLAVAGEQRGTRYWAEYQPSSGRAVEVGLGHGAGALLVGLAQLSTRVPARADAKTLLADATRWLLGRIRPGGHSCFGWFEYEGESQSLIKTDAGWAHGDAGVGLALYAAATALGDRAWQAQAIEVALRSTQRPMADYIQEPNVTISHGAAGLLHIYHQLYRATGRDEFALAAGRWLSWCIDQYSAAAPELPPPPAKGWGFSFVGGHLGVAAVLISLTQAEPPPWTDYIATTMNR
ncbi:MAG: hypothetical protein IPL79_09145 [Myxococcales bacterium]|nr:hypothetical protein [Myxococcales bacterium]